MMKSSKRVLSLIFVVVLICFVLIVCGMRTTKFPFWINKTEIESAWLKEKGTKLNLDEYEYYGTYDDAVVFFSYGMLAVMWQINVAGVEFSWPTNGNLHVYKAGKFYSLEEAYESGLLTKGNIISISIHHKWYQVKYMTSIK